MDEGYKMGVYLCLGQQIHNLSPANAINIIEIKTFKAIQDHYSKYGKIFVFMGEGQHKIKRKAEQLACMEAINFIKLNNDIGGDVILPGINVNGNGEYNDDSE